MSLTKFIDLKDVKAKFRDTFPKPSFERCQDMLAVPLTKNYTLVGTAFDYLLRFHLERTCPFVKRGGWVAGAAMLILEKDTPPYVLAEQILHEAKLDHALYLQDGQLTDKLLRSCLLLAQLDPVFRRKAIVPDLGQINDLDIADLRNILAAVSDQILKPKQLCLLDPTFGRASSLVGGADIDLVVDDTLIDIKTTIDPSLQRQYIDQIIGYYVLYRLGGINGMPEGHQISNLGIYFSRYGRLFTFPVNAIVSEQVFPDFSTWFITRAEQEYGMKWK